MDNLKPIETKIELIRGLEHEMKTKTYSKEGLESTQKVDSEQKEEDLTAWLSNSIQTLGIHVDQFESEIEALTVGPKK
ncbi:hypothetical protein HPB48_017371 [Haemaphysalis longicornis]|uniref:CCR4-Not complex component Not N-terminal domain-containing protein n=1 Tax=Haemaphysalis longicornis TaxID=44386 RepID=A0A9J6F6Q9_HAELO|nr:hypothetical protein HPB48_017371 [Haemaphysalis longicornis]